jgi:hypothetical protein
LTIFPTSAPAWGSSALAAFSFSAFFFALLLPDIDVNAVFSRENYKSNARFDSFVSTPFATGSAFAASDFLSLLTTPEKSFRFKALS